MRLESVGPGDAWTYLRVPFDVEKVFGSRARVSVKGTVNGFPYRSSIFPDGQGHHTMMVNKSMQAGARAAPGDTVKVVMWRDTAPRTVTVPADFKKALAKSPRAKAAFEKLAFSYKRDFVHWIEEAKREETRAARLEKSIALLVAGKRAKS